MRQVTGLGGERGSNRWSARVLEGDSVNEVTFKETMVENSPHPTKATNPHIQEAQEIPSSIDKSSKIHHKQTKIVAQ